MPRWDGVTLWCLRCEKPICKPAQGGRWWYRGRPGPILSVVPYDVVWDDCCIYDKLANLENRCQTAAGNWYACVRNKCDGITKKPIATLCNIHECRWTLCLTDHQNKSDHRAQYLHAYINLPTYSLSAGWLDRDICIQSMGSLISNNRDNFTPMHNAHADTRTHTGGGGGGEWLGQNIICCSVLLWN